MREQLLCLVVTLACKQKVHLIKRVVRGVGGIWVELAVSRASVLLSSCVLRNYYIVIILSYVTIVNSDFYVVHLVCEITFKFILTIR